MAKSLDEREAFDVVGTMGRLLENAYDNVLSIEVKVSIKDEDMSFYYRAGISPHVTMGRPQKERR